MSLLNPIPHISRLLLGTTADKFKTLDDLLVRAYALSDDLIKDSDEMTKVRRRIELAMLHAIRIETALKG